MQKSKSKICSISEVKDGDKVEMVDESTGERHRGLLEERRSRLFAVFHDRKARRVLDATIIELTRERLASSETTWYKA